MTERRDGVAPSAPPPHLRLQSGEADGRDLLVGVDVGGSKVAVLVVDPSLRVRGRHTIPTAVGAPDEAADHIAAAITAALGAAGGRIDRVMAIGVGVPGRIDPLSGIVSLAVNLGWHWLPLRDQLEAILGRPCAIENDVRGAAAGILDRRLLGDVSDFVYLSIGTGISAGVVLDGRLHRGTRGLAGEIGHIVVDSSGPGCPCGLTGCLETIASGPAIARAAAEAIAAGRATSMAKNDFLTSVDVYEAAAGGDALAGEIVLLTAPDPEARERIEAGLAHAAQRGLLDVDRASRSAARVDDLRAWLATFDQPEIGIVGVDEHRALADELAARSLTLVRDDDGRLPLRLAVGSRIAAIMPRPTDQTPADTSSTVAPGLAAALHRRHPNVDEHVVAYAPNATEIAAVREAVRGHDLVVVGTTAALLEPAQAALVEAVLSTDVPVVTVALRTPFDLAAYPASRTHVSTYGILPPSLDALADALFGANGFRGRLPAAIPGLHPTGHGIQT